MTRRTRTRTVDSGTGRFGRIVATMGDGDGADPGTVQGRLRRRCVVQPFPPDGCMGCFTRVVPDRDSGSGAHGRSARNRVQYRVLRQICLLISGYVTWKVV